MIQINRYDDFCIILYVWKCRSLKYIRKVKYISIVSFKLLGKYCYLILLRKLNKLIQSCKKKISYVFLSLCYDLFVKNVDYFYFFIFWFKDKNDEV